MTDDDQEARNLKWQRGTSVIIRQLRSGNWAMYHISGVSAPFWIGPASDIAQAYASRPILETPRHVPTKRAPALNVEFKI